jgi:thermostable 8-oxoguanine DNA glycosylase
METNNRGRKSNEIDFEERLPYLLELMTIKKLSYTEFKVNASKEFGVTQRTAENWWKEIRTRLKERFEQESEEIITEHLTRLFDLLERSKQKGQSRVEREVLADIAKIYGIESPQKVDLTSGGEPVSININLTK